MKKFVIDAVYLIVFMVMPLSIALHPDFYDFIINSNHSKAASMSFQPNRLKFGGTQKCRFVSSPYVTGTARCCVVEKEIKCFPQAIVAGTQKSGTTVLAALLASHPLVRFHPRKEAHYFDKQLTYKSGMNQYLEEFPSWPMGDPLFSEYPPLWMEATPFYVASRDACQRIHRDIFPAIRLVILLREPVSRAYSEYQMKLRRVQSQEEFVGLLNSTRLKPLVFECLQTYRGKFKLLRKCLPDVITGHPHYSKFVRSLSSHHQKHGWTVVADLCYECEEEPVNSSSSHVENSTDIDENSTGIKHFGVAAPSPAEINSSVPSDSSSCRSLEFLRRTCVAKYSSEKIGDQATVFLGEIANITKCLEHSEEGKYSIKDLDDAVGRCIDVKMGISAQFIYRSMYAVQLYHCFKSIPRKNFLILPAELLQRSPQTVLQRVAKFMKIPFAASWQSVIDSNVSNIDFKRGITDEARDANGVADLIKTTFPKFESNTGWKLSGGYEPMDDDVLKKMRAFFDVQNRLLVELLGDDSVLKYWSVSP